MGPDKDRQAAEETIRVQSASIFGPKMDFFVGGRQISPGKGEQTKESDMLLGDCNHCDSPLLIRGNRFSLLFGRSYFCCHCGHPGPSFKEALGRRLRRGYTDQSQSTLEGKETSVTL